uniref:Uncharacterized protein n=1 Tax=Brassica oleracea var. oleracea TaxID=109376 RepID=A0A0D3ATY2_BRAOL
MLLTASPPSLLVFSGRRTMQTHLDDECLGPHGVASVGLSALAHNLYNLEITFQVLKHQASVKTHLHSAKKERNGLPLKMWCSWLNTSKDPVVGNEQKAGALWKRIAAYFQLVQMWKEVKNERLFSVINQTVRPPGVKAAKGASGKRTIVNQQGVSEFEGMWSIKEKDLAAKERLKKMGLLESLISKKSPYLNLKML